MKLRTDRSRGGRSGGGADNTTPRDAARGGGGRPSPAALLRSLLSAPGTEVVALVLSLVWIVFVLMLLFVLSDRPPQGDDALTSVMSFVSIFLPLVLIWIAAAGARASRALRAEAARLRRELDALGGASRALPDQRHQPPAQDNAALERRIEQLAQAQKATESALAMFRTSRQDSPSTTARFAETAARPVAPGASQQSLPLAAPPQPDHTPISVADFIRAVDFPSDENDRDGFRALRLALKDRNISKLVRAAEDLLTLLSQDGIYMDDLTPDRARPDIWRRFAAGERGRAMGALAGVRDRSCLALTAARMKNDMIFRDAAHHFLRQFDRTFAEFEKHASDQDIAELAETRTARAFMLVGRVAGTFD